MNINLQICNWYFRDKVREMGWEKVNIFGKIINFLIVLILHAPILLKILIGKHAYLRQVDIVLTTKCSLRCKECANLMQYYEKPYNISLNSVLKGVEEFLKYFDEIGRLTIIGGESFLSPDLGEVILYIKKFSKINRIQVFTNGTIVPSTELLHILADKKVEIIISDYGTVSKRKHELVEACKNAGVRSYLKSEDLHWGYVGDMHRRLRNNNELSKQFKKCNNHCRTILNGKLFYCPRAAHGMDLGIIDTPNTDYIDLINDRSINKNKILNLVYSTRPFRACDYCNYGTKEMTPIKPGEQMNIAETRKDY